MLSTMYLPDLSYYPIGCQAVVVVPVIWHGNSSDCYTGGFSNWTAMCRMIAKRYCTEGQRVTEWIDAAAGTRPRERISAPFLANMSIVPVVPLSWCATSRIVDDWTLLYRPGDLSAHTTRLGKATLLKSLQY